MPGIKGLDSHSYISVIGCALEYRYIEVVHSSFQILVAVSTSGRRRSYGDVLRFGHKSRASGSALLIVIHDILSLLRNYLQRKLLKMDFDTWNLTLLK